VIFHHAHIKYGTKKCKIHIGNGPEFAGPLRLEHQLDCLHRR
jgi:hypothetical protein